MSRTYCAAPQDSYADTFLSLSCLWSRVDCEVQCYFINTLFNTFFVTVFNNLFDTLLNTSFHTLLHTLSHTLSNIWQVCGRGSQYIVN